MFVILNEVKNLIKSTGLKKKEMKKILVVDDDESIRLLLSKKLAANGYEVVLAACGSEGIETLKEQNFDLISLDMLMPGMSGIETFRKMKAEVKDLPPTIMITGEKTLSVVIEFMQLGGTDYVIKLPDFISSLKLRIERVLEKARQDEELRELRMIKMLAVTLMHSIRNPLTPINGALANLKRELESSDHFNAISKYLDTISRSVKRISDAVNELENMTEIRKVAYSKGTKVIDLKSGQGFEKGEKA